MNWSTERKTLSILIVIGVLLLLAVPLAWYFYPRPSCTDGRQNQGERGVDCGGPCATRCAIDITPLNVEWVRPVRVAPGLYSAVAYVTNANTGLDATNVSYVIRLFNTKGSEIYKRSGNVTIPQNTSLPVFEGNMTVGEEVAVRASLELQSEPLWRPATARQKLSVRDLTLSQAGDVPRLSAVLVNSGVSPVRGVHAIALLYDESDNLVAASQTYLESIPADQSRPVVFTWREPFDIPVVREEVVPLVP